MQCISVHLILFLRARTCALSLQKVFLDNYIIEMRTLKMIINVFKWYFKKNVSKWEHCPPPRQHRCLHLSPPCSRSSSVTCSISSVTKAASSGPDFHTQAMILISSGVQRIQKRFLPLTHFPLTLPFSQWHSFFSPSPSVEALASFFHLLLSFLIYLFLSSRTEPLRSRRNWGWPEWPLPHSPLIVLSCYCPLFSLLSRSFFYLRWFLLLEPKS